MATHKRYSTKEIKFLKDNAGLMSAPEMTRHLDRTVPSIRYKARVMPISLRLYGDNHYLCKITDAEVELIRQLAEDGLRYRVIADKFETTEDYIYQLVIFKKRRGRPCH